MTCGLTVPLGASNPRRGWECERCSWVKKVLASRIGEDAEGPGLLSEMALHSEECLPAFTQSTLAHRGTQQTLACIRFDCTPFLCLSPLHPPTPREDPDLPEPEDSPLPMAMRIHG